VSLRCTKEDLIVFKFAGLEVRGGFMQVFLLIGAFLLLVAGVVAYFCSYEEKILGAAFIAGAAVW